MGNRRITLYIAERLNGYIATPEHNLDWLLSTEGEGDNGFKAYYDSIDTILLGRVTYDWIMEHESEFPYKGKKCYVFSRSRHENTEYVHFINEEPGEFCKNLKEGEGGKIWLVGGAVLNACLLHNKLVDEVVISIAPVLLGQGIPLLAKENIDTYLRLTDMKRYGQFVELHYDVKYG